MALTPKEVTSILTPKTYTTNDFANDVINFNIDERFRIKSLVAQLDAINNSTRDGTDKLIIDFGKDDKSVVSIRMFSPLYNQYKLNKNVNINFTEFTAPPITIPDFNSGV